MAAEAACIPDPQTAWVRSTMIEVKIQALVDRGVLRPKEEVEWRAASREEFTSEDVKSSSLPSSSATSASRWETSSAACCITIGWS
jgi:hypothetical protein